MNERYWPLICKIMHDKGILDDKFGIKTEFIEEVRSLDECQVCGLRKVSERYSDNEKQFHAVFIFLIKSWVWMFRNKPEYGAWFQQELSRHNVVLTKVNLRRLHNDLKL